MSDTTLFMKNPEVWKESVPQELLWFDDNCNAHEIILEYENENN